jgi:hypothetical protein
MGMTACTSLSQLPRPNSAVLYPDLPPGYLSRHRNLWDEVEVVFLQTVDKFRVAGQLVVVVTGHERDRYLAARLLELLE